MKFPVDDVVEHKRSGQLYMVTNNEVLFKFKGVWYAAYEYVSLDGNEQTYVRIQEDMELEFEVVL